MTAALQWRSDRGCVATIRAFPPKLMSPTSPLYVQSELEHQLADAGVSVIVCLSALFNQVAAVRPNLPELRHVIVTNIKDYFPTHLRMLFSLTKERKDGHRVSLPRDER